MELPPDWSEFLSLLSRHRVKFLLIGAHALAQHGHVRATLDLDVFVEASLANARRLAAALAEFGFPEFAKQSRQLATADRMLRLGNEPLRIDILNRISGVSFRTAWKRRVHADFGGIPVNVLSLADFRANKRASGRAKDLVDLALLDEGRPRRAVRAPRPRTRTKKR